MKKGAVALIDFLGQKGIWERQDPKLVLETVKGLREKVLEHVSNGNHYLTSVADKGAPPMKLEVFFISDTFFLLAWYEDLEDESNRPSTCCPLVYMLGKIVGDLVREASIVEPPRTLRGCISTGEFDFLDNIIIGKAIDEAAEVYESANGPFVHLTDAAKGCLDEARKSGILSSEEVSLFVDYEIGLKRRSGPPEYDDTTVPVLNPFSEETNADKNAFAVRVLSSFDKTSASVMKKMELTSDFLKHLENLDSQKDA